MIGLSFYDRTHNREMMLITEGQLTGWLAYLRADGRWVAVRPARREDYDAVRSLRDASNS